MEHITKYLIIITSLMTLKLTLTESKDNSKLKFDRRYYTPFFINICEIDDRRCKVFCYCDSDNPKMANNVDCWVFGGGIKEDDPIWPNFSSQSEIENLTFNARSDDALTFVPAKAIVRLDKLKYVSIQYGSIDNILPYAFTNSSTIKQIVLKSNKITNLEKHAFAQMMMLSNLSLEDNLLTELKRDVFFNLPNLHILHLSNNNLSLIHEGCFKHLNNLIELKLDSNYISVITKETLEGLENLSKLNLQNNKLTMIGNLAFSESWGLKELMIDNNAIEYISDRAFGGLTQLRMLTLAGNRLSAFYEDLLEDINSLVVLDLRDNILETISYESIRPVVENKQAASVAVYLDGNPLSCNCRLSWIYMLRNDTKDDTLKHALANISCIEKSIVNRQTNSQEIEQVKNSNILSDDSYEYYDEIKTIAKKLIDIPSKSLACPKEIMQSIEQTYGHPVQNEIRLKSFSAVSKIIPNSILTAILAKMLF